MSARGVFLLALSFVAALVVALLWRLPQATLEVLLVWMFGVMPALVLVVAVMRQRAEIRKAEMEAGRTGRRSVTFARRTKPKARRDLRVVNYAEANWSGRHTVR